MILALLSPLLGMLLNSVPSIINLFAKGQEYKHEIALTRLQMDVAIQTAQLGIDLEQAKADANEGESLRRHDSELDGGPFINAIRASIRPVITYVFFFAFIIIKSSAAYMMMASGMDIPTMLITVWDEQTVALFGAIMGFWFGSRTIERLSAGKGGKNAGIRVNVVKKSDAEDQAKPDVVAAVKKKVFGPRDK